jgi:hypothetical protein
LAELDGSPLDGVRQRTVQTALLAALAALRDRGLDAAEAGHGE